MSNRTNGSIVRQFEEAFAAYVGAKYAIAMCNGTATLHTALVALGVKPGDQVAVPPLTMASTTLAVLHAGGVPEFWDVAPDTWVMGSQWGGNRPLPISMPVSLYGLSPDWNGADPTIVDDAAQTLRQHSGCAFTSYSFQASKILSAGEGGMLVTDDWKLAAEARSFHNLGYFPASVETLKNPNAARHRCIGYNYRMSDLQAAHLLPQLERADEILAARRYSAECYRQAIAGIEWITPQYVPEGWPHSWWTYAIALKDKEMWEPLAQAIVAQGGERPYAAWRLTYHEPAFRHLIVPMGATADDWKRRGEIVAGLRYGEDVTGICPVAEGLQPRLMQLQTNHDQPQAERAAEMLRQALAEVEVRVS